MINLLLDATRVQELVDVIEKIIEERRVNWRSVGDLQNNLAIINLGSNPAAGVVERTTNAIDAILELVWQQKNCPTGLNNPRMAVESWYGFDNGQLATVRKQDLKKIDEIAELVCVSLRDSDRNDLPTVDIRDFGIGLSAEEFPESILSLNKSRKLRKLYLSGAFGQGGSTALSYSPFTVIVSKCAQSEKAAFTVVRFNQGDIQLDKHGIYEYLVNAETGYPFEDVISNEDFRQGTLVRHMSMDLGKFSSVITAPTGSLWYLMHHYLFDPVLPFTIEDKRTGKNQAKRMVTGNHRLLTQSDITEYQRDAILSFNYGSVKIKWWVISSEGDSARNRITQYTMASKPIIVTYNGQKQGDFPNTIIKDDLKLPYLDRYLVVHVDCDSLDPESRRQLFPTTREALRDTKIGDDLRRLVTETLAADDDLVRYDKERKQRYLRQDDNESIDNIRRRLAKRVTVYSAGMPGGFLPKVLPPNTTTSINKKIPIPTNDPPSFIKITSDNPKKVYTDRQFTIKFETDARPEYFNDPDTFISIVTPPSFGRFTGMANVRDGYGIAYFKANDELDEGTMADIILEIRPHGAQSINDSIGVVIFSFPESVKPGSGSESMPNINPQWVIEGDNFWKDNEWNASSVAKVVHGDESVDIYVSAGNEKLNKLISRAQRIDTSAVDNVKNFYLEHLAYFAVLSELDKSVKLQNGANESQSEMIVDVALRHACETICGIVESVFQVIAAGKE